MARCSRRSRSTCKASSMTRCACGPPRGAPRKRENLTPCPPLRVAAVERAAPAAPILPDRAHALAHLYLTVRAGHTDRLCDWSAGRRHPRVHTLLQPPARPAHARRIVRGNGVADQHVPHARLLDARPPRRDLAACSRQLRRPGGRRVPEWMQPASGALPEGVDREGEAQTSVPTWPLLSPPHPTHPS